MSNVLIVDDEKYIRDDLREYLKKKKFSTFKASSIGNAKKKIKEKPLDFAIIDLNLDSTSEFGGITVFRFIKEHKPKIKIIILTAYPFDDVKEDLRKELKGEKEPEKILDEIKAGYVWKGGNKNYITAIQEKLIELTHGNR